jgi:hypothetical protein
MKEPVTMTSNSTPTGYGANSSSGGNPYQAFDNNYSTFWESDSDYDDTTGNYTGSIITTVDGNPVNGEWIQIQIPNAITLKEFMIIPRYAFEFSRSPQDFIVAGSNNGLNWTQVCSFSGQTYLGFFPKTFIISSPIPTAFKYFRLITTVVGGGGASGRTSINIVQWTLNFDFIWNELENVNRDWTDIAVGTGTGDYSSIFACVNNGAIFQTIYESDTWTPTTTPYNWNTVSMSIGDVAIATVKGGQIYTSENFYPRQHTFLVKYNPEGVPQWANYVNCPTINEADNIGMSLGVQPTGEIILSGMVLNNNGGSVECFSPSDYTTPIKSLHFTENIPPTMLSDTTPPGYEASASTFYFYLYVPYKAFDNNATTFWHSAPFQYDNNTGEYIGSNSTIVNGIPVFGDWLQIQLRKPYILTQFTITPRNDLFLYNIRSPQDFIVAGSNDNINWIQVCAFTGQTYSDVTPKLFVISNPIQTTFKYFRLITTVVGGGGPSFGDRDSVQITQWTFQGDGTRNAERFLACYSNDGLPLWINRIQMQTGESSSQALSQIKSITADTFGNIYCFGYCSFVSFYNPTGQKVYTDDEYIDYNDITAILVKYYPDGSFQSCARVISAFGNCYGNSIRVINGKIYVSGFIDSSTYLYAYSSDYSVAQGTTFYRSGIFVTKYLSDDFYSPFEFPSPGYPEVLQTRLKIGGSVRKLVGGYVYDGPVETWGGQTGFTPGAITLEDANTGVVAHLGHEPGYSNRLNVNDYLYDYPYLTVNLSEPSFPLNDPQPVTPGTIPYGFLPIYISAPESTTSLKFNTDYVNDINSNVDAMLYAAGSASEDGTFFSKIYTGDVIRLMIIINDVSNVSNVSNQYITLKVKGVVVSKSPDIPAAIVFEEPVSYLQAVIGGIQTSSSMLITTTHIFDRVDIPGAVSSSSSYDFVNQILLCPDATFESTVFVGDYISICTYDNFLGKISCFTSIVEGVLSDTLLQLKFIYGSGMYNYDIISIQKLIITPKKYLSAFIQPVLVQSGTLQITLETIPQNN